MASTVSENECHSIMFFTIFLVEEYEKLEVVNNELSWKEIFLVGVVKFFCWK